MTEPRPTSADDDRWPWWFAPFAVCVVGSILSLLQPSLVSHRDIRLEAARSVIDGSRSYFGDPDPSIEAARRLARDPRARLYDADLRVGSAFIYPPLAALPYRPLALLPTPVAHDRLMWANRVLAALSFGLLLRMVFAGRKARWKEAAAALTGAAIYYPLLHAIELNQAMVLVTVLLGGAFVAICERRPALAGALVAIAIVFKPHLVLMLPLLAWHARRTILTAIGSGTVLLIVSVFYAGTANHVEYAARVLPSLSRGYAYYANQSFNGLFNRLFVTGDIGVFAQPPSSIMVTTLTVVAFAATYLAALWLARRWRRKPGSTPWVFAFAWLVATVISPIAWQHHYAPALFVFAMSMRAVCDAPGLRLARFTVPLAAAFAMMAAYFEVRTLQAAGPRILASYMFFGALTLVVAIAKLIEARSANAAPPDAASSGP